MQAFCGGSVSEMKQPQRSSPCAPTTRCALRAVLVLELGPLLHGGVLLRLAALLLTRTLYPCALQAWYATS